MYSISHISLVLVYFILQFHILYIVLKKKKPHTLYPSSFKVAHFIFYSWICHASPYKLVHIILLSLTLHNFSLFEYLNNNLKAALSSCSTKEPNTAPQFSVSYSDTLITDGSVSYDVRLEIWCPLVFKYERINKAENELSIIVCWI